MSLSDRWLLPDGVDELLPPRATQLEELRRHLLNLFASWGYELVMPPLIEYLESLLTGLGPDVELKTFKLTDQLTGRLMGVRADMTPQVARIDAHRLDREGPSRLCYIGPVLHTKPGSFAASRNPLQLGAELYGHAGVESDVEVLSLMVEMFAQVGLARIYVNLNHIGIFRGLISQVEISGEQEGLLFDVLQRKATPELEGYLSSWDLPASSRSMLGALVELNGGPEVLEVARTQLAAGGAQVLGALDELEQIYQLAGKRRPELGFHFDLAEMRGYGYHTGVMFEAYVPGQGQSLAWGGRYDNIGRLFGRSRPATGFSTDLKLVAAVDNERSAPRPSRIFAPVIDDAALVREVRRLREVGEVVVQELPGDGGAQALDCDRVLVAQDGGWVLAAVSP